MRALTTSNAAPIPSTSTVDERDHINVLVQTAEGKFPLFRQSKYGYVGEALAPVGGFINDGETALEAAKREIREELGLESDQWTALGSYRTAVNRGGGTLHAFYASNAQPAAGAGKGVRVGFDATSSPRTTDAHLHLRSPPTPPHTHTRHPTRIHAYSTTMPRSRSGWC